MNFPKTSGQCKYSLALNSVQAKPILICTGPAGSGKTLLACHLAASEITKFNCKRIVITRPIVAVDEDMGYLPGDINQKMEPWTRPMYDIFEKYMNYSQITRTVSIEPLGYMRGRTFDNTLIIADEMQNSSINQMKLLLTRIGTGSRVILTGDLDQSDMDKDNGLSNLLYRMQLNDLKYMEHVELSTEDVVRNPAVKEVLKVLEQ